MLLACVVEQLDGLGGLVLLAVQRGQADQDNWCDRGVLERTAGGELAALIHGAATVAAEDHAFGSFEDRLGHARVLRILIHQFLVRLPGRLNGGVLLLRHREDGGESLVAIAELEQGVWRFGGLRIAARETVE